MPDFTSTQQTFEFRGVDSLYIARVTQDDAEGYVTDTPIYLSPVAEVSKATESASEAHYYDNKAMIVVNSESADTITITMAPPVLEKLALVTGKSFDEETGMMVDSERVNDYWALMYRTKGTDGKYRYVSRLKGTFNIPEEDNQTENDGTDTTNTSIEYTGIYTEYQFNKGKYENGAWTNASAKGIVVDTRYGLADVSSFFSQTQTPDTIQATSIDATAVAVSPSTASVTVDETVDLTATLTPEGATSEITWSITDATKATFMIDGVPSNTATGASVTVKGLEAGTTAVTATANGHQNACVLTVEAAG